MKSTGRSSQRRGSRPARYAFEPSIAHLRNPRICGYFRVEDEFEGPNEVPFAPGAGRPAGSAGRLEPDVLRRAFGLPPVREELCPEGGESAQDVLAPQGHPLRGGRRPALTGCA